MHKHMSGQGGNVFKGVGYGLLLSAAIAAAWVAAIIALF